MGSSCAGAAAVDDQERDERRLYRLVGEADGGIFECLASNPAPAPDDYPRAFLLLSQALDECVAAGLLQPRDRAGAEQLCWIAVHGLAMQAVQGILPAQGPDFQNGVSRR